MAKTPGRHHKSSFGIAEWYGELYKNLTRSERMKLVDAERSTLTCPFLSDMPHLAPRGRTKCNKAGGVCSLRSFNIREGNITFGAITCTCPNRFLEGGTVFSQIGNILLGSSDTILVKEIPFLIRPSATDEESDTHINDADPANDNEDVGRIDMVMVHPNLDRLDWCAIELQAVYFSGGAMSKDYDVIRSHLGDDVPMPGANRRPDFRSCGPKRLMPQLQTKVPTLRRWGKKMAVVVDRPFFDALGPMDHVPDLSNSDIIWFIVRFEENDTNRRATLIVDKVRYTTLERAVEGLTAGIPTSLGEFETKIRNKLMNA